MAPLLHRAAINICRAVGYWACAVPL